VRQRYSHIVIGAGALGSAAAYWLSEKAGTSVLVLEQYRTGHTFGASEDHSRIIRHAYHSTEYTRLAPAAYTAWEHVEAATGLRLVHRTGGLDIAVAGTPGAQAVARARDALRAVGTPVEELDTDALRTRWPQWRFPGEMVGIHQPDGWILDIRHATAAHLALARARGVDVRDETPVHRIDGTGEAYVVHTPQGRFTADHLVLCAGSWTGQLLPDLGVDLPITLSQEQVGYFATPNLREFAMDRFPVWIWHGERTWYGFPVYGEPAIKLARDMAGRFVTQETRSFEPDPAETEILRGFVAEHLPAGLGPERLSKTCVYDMPPDREFIADTLPGHPRVAVCVGAGHGGKFAGLLGQILADLVTEGGTAHPIEAFRADRPALTDPDFVPTFHHEPTSAGLSRARHEGYQR
jgi:monomeric sarcosine oxidase